MNSDEMEIEVEKIMAFHNQKRRKKNKLFLDKNERN